jgi:cyclic-di-AMP phosphodiesterase PgpH
MKGIFQRRPEVSSGYGALGPGAGVTWRELRPRLAIFAGLAILTVALFPSRSVGPVSDVRAGMIAPEDVIAPFDYRIPKTTQELEHDRALAAISVRRMYRPAAPADSVLKPVTEYVAKVARIAEAARRPGAIRQPAPQPPGAGAEPAEQGSDLTSEIDSYGGQRLGLTASEIAALQNSTFRDSVATGLLAAAAAAHRELWVVTQDMLGEIQGNTVVLVQDSSEISVLRRDLRLPPAAIEGPIWRDALEGASQGVRAVVGKLGSVLLPSNLVFLPLETEARREEARRNVPTVKGEVLSGELVVGAHMRVTSEQAEKLAGLRTELQRRAQAVTAEELKPLAGHLLFSAILLGLLFLYLYLYRPEIFDSMSSFLLLSLGVALLLGFASLIYYLEALPIYFLPAAFLSILLAILFDGRLAMVVSVICSILLFGQGDVGFEGLFVVLAGGIGGALSVRVLRQRHQFYETMLVVAVAKRLAIGTLSLMYVWPLRDTLGAMGWGLLNALVSGLLAMGLLPLLETVFKKTTDITLLELSDLNRPLLKKMALEAPGTYHHSIMVGNLAEAAAEGAGANSLLARVGCYYHDIGKLRKPEYFAENQRRGLNPHDGLKPRMSALIIINHVKEGMEMAREAKLPDQVIDFIREHHGTTTISFFVEKARKLDPAAEINLADYSYPGPKPRSKETAIAMLADNVEAVSRVLVDPTPSRIRNLVERLVKRKIEERQLEEANLTFHELAVIQERFTALLMAIFHARPEYPTFAVNVETDDAPVESHAAESFPQPPASSL